MITEKKSIHFIQFLAKRVTGKAQQKKICLMEKERVDKAPTQDECDETIEGEMDLDKSIVKFVELNQVAYKDLILSIISRSTIEKWQLDW